MGFGDTKGSSALVRTVYETFILPAVLYNMHGESYVKYKEFVVSEIFFRKNLDRKTFEIIENLTKE